MGSTILFFFSTDDIPSKLLQIFFHLLSVYFPFQSFFSFFIAESYILSIYFGYYLEILCEKYKCLYSDNLYIVFIYLYFGM